MEGNKTQTFSLSGLRDEYIWEITFVCVLVGCLWFYLRKSRLKLPPGPWRWPVLGNLPQLNRSMRRNKNLPHRALAELSNTYGGLMTIQMGSLTCVVVSSTDWFRTIFTKYDGVVADKGNSLIGEVLYRNYQLLALVPYTKQHLMLKGICTEHLLGPKAVKQNQDLREKVILTAVQRLLAESEEGRRPTNVALPLEDLEFTYISHVLFHTSYLGLKVCSGDDELTLQDVVRRSTSLDTFSATEMFPSLRMFDIGGVEAGYRNLREGFDLFLDRIIEERRKKREKGEIDKSTISLVDALLEHDLPDELIKGVIQDMMLGGIDTGATVMVWCLTELMKNPDKLQRVQTELDHVVGKDRVVEEADLVNLPYLQAVVKETFRVHIPAPISPRCPTGDIKIEGYDIPKNARVLFNYFAVTRDPSVWKDPLIFSPERFLSSKIDMKGFHYEFLPFGSGRRKCPGMNLGHLMVTLSVAHVLHACEFSLPEAITRQDLDVEEDFGLTAHKRNPLRLLVAPRFPSSAYKLKFSN